MTLYEPPSGICFHGIFTAQKSQENRAFSALVAYGDLYSSGRFQIRSLMLYPVELRAPSGSDVGSSAV
jgi:hypothetical protein